MGRFDREGSKNAVEPGHDRFDLSMGSGASHHRPHRSANARRNARAPAAHVPVYSIKGAIGNPLAAAGPLQVAAAIFFLRDGVVPPTANLDVPIPEALDFVRESARYSFPETALLNAHGIGGANVTLLLKAPPTGLAIFRKAHRNPNLRSISNLNLTNVLV